MIKYSLESLNERFTISSRNPCSLLTSFISGLFAPLLRPKYSHFRRYKNFQNSSSGCQIQTFNPGYACECAVAVRMLQRYSRALTQGVKFKRAFSCFEKSIVSANRTKWCDDWKYRVENNTTAVSYRSKWRSYLKRTSFLSNGGICANSYSVVVLHDKIRM